MRVLIEDYRGWEIYFDTEREEFYTVSNEYDNQNTKKSYQSVKKYIDDYIKDNFEFKPIKFQQQETMFNDESVITLIGIRKDGRFMYEDSDGVKRQMSDYSESNYFKVDERNRYVLMEIDKINGNIKTMQEEKKKLSEKLIKVTVADYKKELLNKD